MSNRESTTQGNSGQRGSEASQTEGDRGQPRQGANRVERPSGESEPKHHFEPGRAPSEQGEQEHPSPEVVARRQQGFAGTGTGASGSTGAHGDRSEEEAESGAPKGDHTRHGRQKTPGDRPRK